MSPQFNFREAPLFRKSNLLNERDIEIACEEKEVITCVNGIVETAHKAKPGDLIVTGIAGEKYVSSKKTFLFLHERCADNPQFYKPLHRVRALFQREDVTIMANWGEELVVKAGGVVVYRLNDNKLYGNQASTFEDTYSRADEDGKVICSLQIPLEQQLERAREARAILHEADILARIEFRDQPGRLRHMSHRSLRQRPQGGFASRSP